MIAQTLNVSALQDELAKFANERDWEQFHSPKNLAMALTVEAGELMEIFQWLTPQESNGIANIPELQNRVKEEIADVLLYLLKLAGKLDIDLESACRAKIEINKKKYPVELAKGNAKKYSEFEK